MNELHLSKCDALALAQTLAADTTKRGSLFSIVQTKSLLGSMQEYKKIQRLCTLDLTQYYYFYLFRVSALNTFVVSIFGVKWVMCTVHTGTSCILSKNP